MKTFHEDCIVYAYKKRDITRISPKKPARMLVLLHFINVGNNATTESASVTFLIINGKILSNRACKAASAYAPGGFIGDLIYRGRIAKDRTERFCVDLFK